MPKFSEVFSTTWKALLALFLISLGMGFVYLILGAIGNRGTAGRSHDWEREYEQKNADEASTKMPQSQWDKEMKRCAKHTVIEGMTKDEVSRAVGGNEPWTYSIVVLKGTDQKCIRYEGEQCVEYPPMKSRPSLCTSRRRAT